MVDKNDAAQPGQNIIGLMAALITEWNARIDQARAATEFAPVRPADLRVFAQLRGPQMKLSEIHRVLGFSRQAAQQAVDRLVGHGMLRVDPLPGSKRDKAVTMTSKGQRWRGILAAQSGAIDHQIAEVIGDDGKEALRGHLIELVGRLPE